MISFIAAEKPKLSASEFKKMDYADVIRYGDRSMEIYVSGQLFYKDEYFPMLEFCRYALKWLSKRKRIWSKSGDFIYNAVETEENPQLAFISKPDGYSIHSAWQRFECADTFKEDEVISFIKSVLDYVISFND